MLTLRCYDSGESMAIMQMHPQQLSQVKSADGVMIANVYYWFDV